MTIGLSRCGRPRPPRPPATKNRPGGNTAAMKWRGRGRSGTDRSDRRGAGGGLGGGGMPLPMGAARRTWPINAPVLFLVFGGGLPGGGGGLGVDPGTGQFEQAPAPSEAIEKAPADDPGKFVDFVAGDVDLTWKKPSPTAARRMSSRSPSSTTARWHGLQRAVHGRPFTAPAIARSISTSRSWSSCSSGSARRGTSRRHTSSPTRSANHVQNLLGVMDDVNLAQQESPPTTPTTSRCGLRAQADCLAGTGRTRPCAAGDLLETGDLEEALTAAAAVGDDRIQKQAGGEINPDTFTHGSGEQRVTWFKKGFQNGDPSRPRHLQGDV